ncbi:hypothetical protein PIB30_050444 [Stylosanthes scabra]|uniref:Uncharacterized protein n=1 Tax=Stylosanthes scabra TaxID=79078 RepID=A0ABU6SHI4_9FABA|nr:hypothetical protein [Stylosanthes scabra]
MAVKKAAQSDNVEDAIEKVNDLNPEVCQTCERTSQLGNKLEPKAELLHGIKEIGSVLCWMGLLDIVLITEALVLVASQTSSTLVVAAIAVAVVVAELVEQPLLLRLIRVPLPPVRWMPPPEYFYSDKKLRLCALLSVLDDAWVPAHHAIVGYQDVAGGCWSDVRRKSRNPRVIQQTVLR